MQWSKGEYRDNGLKNDAVDFCNIVLFYRSSLSYCMKYIVAAIVSYQM